jgi:glucose-6-phosphate 1-epimerase
LIKKIKDELEYFEVSNTQSKIKIAFQGAHIFDFIVKGKGPLLFLSESSNFKLGKAIRGGIPICWPWFGAHKTDSNLANHGFARTSIWSHVKTLEINEDKTLIVMKLKNSPETLELWPYAFELKLEILMSDVLELSLITTNLSTEPFKLTQALHTYLLVENIYDVQIDGLDKKTYYNKVDNSFDNIQKEYLTFTQEIDRVYQGISDPLLLQDKNQDIEINTIGSDTVVIWNPAKELSKKMLDLDTYKTMLCIESANTDEIQVNYKGSHTLKTILSQRS